MSKIDCLTICVSFLGHIFGFIGEILNDEKSEERL